MGFTQSTTIQSDITCASAYFKVARIDMYDLANRRCSFKLEAWKDQTARNDPAKGKLKGVTTVLRFNVEGDDFDTYFGDNVLAATGISILKKCYDYARAHADYIDATDVDPDE